MERILVRLCEVLPENAVIGAGRHPLIVAWVRGGAGLVLCLSACTIERGGLHAPRNNSAAAPVSATRDAGSTAARDASSPAAIDPEPDQDAGIDPGAVSDEPMGSDAGPSWPDAGADASMTDACPGDAVLCDCDAPEIDSDDDSTPDCRDACPLDAQKVAPGACGCGEEERDGDNDGVMNCEDACPRDPNKAHVGICGCGKADVDADGSGTLDCLERRTRGR